MLDSLEDLALGAIDRLVVIATSIVTRLVAYTAAAQVLLANVGENIPVIGEKGSMAVAAFAGLVSVIRNVTRVNEASKGLL